MPAFDPAVVTFLITCAFLHGVLIWGESTWGPEHRVATLTTRTMAADAADLPSSKPPKMLRGALVTAGADESTGVLSEAYCRRMIMGARNTLNSTVGQVGKTTVRSPQELMGELQGAALDPMRDLLNAFPGGLGGPLREESRDLIFGALLQAAIYDTQLKKRYLTILVDPVLFPQLSRGMDPLFRWLPGGHVTLSDLGVALVESRRKKRTGTAGASGPATPSGLRVTGPMQFPMAPEPGTLLRAPVQPEAEETPRKGVATYEAPHPGPGVPVMPRFEEMMPQGPVPSYVGQMAAGYMQVPSAPTAPLLPPGLTGGGTTTTPFVLPGIPTTSGYFPPDPPDPVSLIRGGSGPTVAVHAGPATQTAPAANRETTTTVPLSRKSLEALDGLMAQHGMSGTTPPPAGGTASQPSGAQRTAGAKLEAWAWKRMLSVWESETITFVDRIIGSLVTVFSTFTVTICFAAFGHLVPTVGGSVATIFAFYRWFHNSANQILVSMTGAAMVAAGAGVGAGSEALAVLGFACCLSILFYAILSGALQQESESRAPSRTPSQAGDDPQSLGGRDALMIADLEAQLQLERLRNSRIEAAMQQPVAAMAGYPQVALTGGPPPPVQGQGGPRVISIEPEGLRHEQPGPEMPPPMQALQAFAGGDPGSGAYTVTGQRMGLGQQGVQPMAPGAVPGLGGAYPPPGYSGSPTFAVPPALYNQYQHPASPSSPTAPPHFRAHLIGAGYNTTGAPSPPGGGPGGELAGEPVPKFEGAGIGNGLSALYVWMGWEIYWNVIRVAASTCVQFLERFWPGPRDDGVYLQLYQKCSQVDAALQNAFNIGGDEAVEWVLRNDVPTEISLNSVAVEWDVQIHGDTSAASSMLAVKPAGSADLVPQWALDRARLHSRDVHRQQERVTAGSAYGKVAHQELFGLRRRQGWLGDAIPKAPRVPQPKNPKGPKGPKPPPVPAKK